jgi:hypothetical protein
VTVSPANAVVPNPDGRASSEIMSIIAI